MDYKTFSEIRDKIQMELDLETEDFIQPEEFKSFVNDAITVVEAEIHKLGLEDEYFLTRTTRDLVDDEADIEMPSNIFENKIREIIYQVGVTIYEVKRMRASSRFEDRALSNLYPGTDYYRYLIRNDGPGSSTVKPVIELVPPSQETVDDALTIWYFRKANRWTTDDDAYCDIPEIALQYLYAYVRYRCYDKEGHPNKPDAKADSLEARQLMIETLTNMVPDEESEIDKDLTSYDEFS